MRLVQYGKQKNVGFDCVWAHGTQLQEIWMKLCAKYAAKWVSKGFKIDFLDRNDQKTIAYHIVKLHLLLPGTSWCSISMACLPATRV